MSILNALRNKIVNRVFACVNSEKRYDPKYKKCINDIQKYISLSCYLLFYELKTKNAKIKYFISISYYIILFMMM